MIALSVAALVLVSAAEAIGATGAEATRRCDRRSSSMLLKTSKVRIFALPEEPAAHQHRHPVIAGRRVFGCLLETGKARLLDLPDLGGEVRPGWVEVDSHALAANGPLVAYAYTQYYVDFHKVWVRVRNLRTGAIVRDCYVGGSLAPHRTPHVTDIVLSSFGEVGWNAEGEGPEASEEHAQGCNPTA